MNKKIQLPPVLKKYNTAVLIGFILAGVALKVSEDVIAGESGQVDKVILLFIHSHMPSALTPFFEIVTLSGSARILLPLTIVITGALLLYKHRSEALLLTGSVISAELVIYLIKTMVGRERPALWETRLYWGSSFPSGHTLAVAAFAVAAALCVMRLQPRARGIVLAAAVLWIFLVALSRLVLGVHWPTDVLAAASIGALLPLVLKALLSKAQF